jgi:hypothetical protein
MAGKEAVSVAAVTTRMVEDVSEGYHWLAGKTLLINIVVCYPQHRD